MAGGGMSAVVLAACGGQRDGGPSGAGAVREVTQIASTRQAETAQPKPGGVINVRQNGNAPLDPHQNSTFLAQTLAGYTQARLLKFKTGADPRVADNYDTEPDLAESIEIPSDGLTVTVRLRPNVRFHDIAPVSGRTLDSEDVRFSVERFRTDPKNNNRGVFGTPQNPLVEAVETPDARTVVFKLAKPYGPFQNLLANSNYLWIMAKEIGQNRFDPGKQAIGVGPFMLDSVQPDILFRLKKHPGYYDAPRPYLDGVNLNVITEEAQEVAQFQAGRLDVAAIPPPRADEVRKSVPKAEMVEYLPQSFGFLSFQLRGNSIFRDERIRRAAQMSIDRDALISLIYQGSGAWLSSIPANFGKWRVDPKSAEMGDAARYFKHDPAEAKKLIAAAGYPNGLPTRYIYSNNAYGELFNQAAEAIAGMLKEGGFNHQVVTQDYLREFITPGTGTVVGNFEGMFYAVQAAFSDPHDYFYTMYHTKSSRNHGGVNDPQLDAMIDKEEATLNVDERVKQVKDIQRYLADKVYYANGVVGPLFFGVQEWAKNFQRNNGNGAGSERYAKMWIDRG
jgi:peptide/nickel transport system substrate-binding protein